MRSVHLLGLGLLVGSVALGAMLSVMTFRWQEESFPAQGPAAVQKASAATVPLSGDAAKGKATFDASCASCHSIGGGKRVGPDLKGISAQRPHDWLVQFIVAPDKVIASGDPVAKQLVAEFGVPMPNMGVSNTDAENVLAYIAAQSGGGAAPAPASGQPSTSSAAPAPTAAVAAPAPTAAVAAPAPAAAAAAPAAPAGQGSAQAQTLFNQKCASCHTIGGGKLAGPDLKGISAQRPHDWLVSFITAPDKVIASGDPVAKQLVAEFGMPMPNMGVSNTDAEALLSYIAAQSGGGAAAPQAGAAAAPALPPGNATTGRLLFTGEQRLANGGPGCYACHNAAGIGALGGGTMGLDLTKAQTKLGATAIPSILQSPPFPGMTEAYAGHPITTQEVADLAAFLAQLDTTQQAPSPDFAFPLVGLGAFVLFLAVMQVGQRGRSQGARERLVERRGK